MKYIKLFESFFTSPLLESMADLITTCKEIVEFLYKDQKITDSKLVTLCTDMIYLLHKKRAQFATNKELILSDEDIEDISNHINQLKSVLIKLKEKLKIEDSVEISFNNLIDKLNIIK